MSANTLSQKDVAKVASLARIKMSEEELKQYAEKLSGIIGFVEQLDEVNTDNVEPLASVVDISLSLRQDEVTDGDMAEKILANAPETLEGFFVVPKVVE